MFCNSPKYEVKQPKNYWVESQRSQSWQLMCMEMNITKNQSDTLKSDATVCTQACIIDLFLFNL